MYLRRRRLDRRGRVHDPDQGGADHADDPLGAGVHAGDGPGEHELARLPVRASRTAAESSRRAAASWAFQHVSIGNPQCAIEVGDELEALDLAAIGPEIEGRELFPNRTNVSFFRADGERVRARIFERGVGETLSSGTGASGAAVAAHLAGAPADPHGRARRRRARGRDRRRARGPADRLGRAALRRRALAGAARAGSRARSLPDSMAAPVKKRGLTAPSERLEAMPPYMFAELERRIEAKRDEGIDVISLGIGDPGHADLPLRRRGDAGGGRGSRQRRSTRATAAAPSSARPSPTSTCSASGSRSTRRTR